MKPRARWVLPPGLWTALLSFGLGVLLMFGLGAWWVDKRITDLGEDKDRAMCQLIDRLIGDTAPPAGPAGQRAREIRADMVAYRGTLNCRR